MSRIGKLPVPIPSDVKVDLDGSRVTVEGPKGKLNKTFHPDMTISVEDQNIVVKRPSDKGFHRGLHGLTRALLYNMVTGVTKGFEKKLQIVGVGYRAEVKGSFLQLFVGYSHSVLVKPPEGVQLEFAPKEGIITVTGIDKQLVGLTADRIRNVRKPDPYKGKGIRYVDEHIRRKAGKTAA